MVILADGAFVDVPDSAPLTGTAVSSPEPERDDGPAALPSFERVYREYAIRVYRYCLSQVGNASDADDLTAEVFAAAFAAYPGVRLRDGVVLPWLLRIARNEIIDQRRRHSRRSALLARFFGGESEQDRSVDVEGEVVTRDELQQVVTAMRGLSARDRTLIGLRIAAGLPFAEIGQVLGISEHAATVATKRALQRLRRHVEAAR
ncbi:MAG TPA: sigma-70 family RNA polymerase sigma factor [Actinophytocola sp.]|uniref:RNA polymerase sigma factor n=1 Tax=Actinophytocola sp. TaxID=1872138 RepID=UPI002E06E30E|nr:sigma-70 family RNA polymerase sigma factor [Actinophytocola sp.]